MNLYSLDKLRSCSHRFLAHMYNNIEQCRPYVTLIPRKSCIRCVGLMFLIRNLFSRVVEAWFVNLNDHIRPTIRLDYICVQNILIILLLIQLGGHLKWKSISLSHVITFASSLQFWNLEWQFAWIIVFAKWMRQFPNLSNGWKRLWS